MDESFKVLEIQEIYRGSLVSVYREKVESPGGEVYFREVVRGVRAAAVVAVADGDVILIDQYRHPTRGRILEIPAGIIDPNEEPAETAVRELREETGYRAGKVTHLEDFYTTPGYSDEVLSLFLATDLESGDSDLEVDEEIEVMRVPLSEAVRMVDEGEISDAKTIIGILLAARRLQRP